MDTELGVKVIGRLVGYRGAESLSRAFKKHYGVRPLVYREFRGGLSLVVARDAKADRPPLAPRYLAGAATPAAGVRCGRCAGELETEVALRVFEDLAPICDGCAREQAPELAGLLGVTQGPQGLRSPEGGSS